MFFKQKTIYLILGKLVLKKKEVFLLINEPSYFRPIPAHDKGEVQVEVMGWRSGPTTVVATFSSRELFNLNGTQKVNVIS
jgi:hypothetical protein